MLKPRIFIAKAPPFNGNFGIFEDSLIQKINYFQHLYN